MKNFLATKKPRKRRGRIPPSCNGVQVNHCKEPTCPNFGVAADPDPPSRGRYADPARQDVYKVGRKKGNPKLICKECGSEIVMKSNVGIYEEYERSSAYLAPQVVCCPDPKCKNHKKPLGSAKGLYKSKGLTPRKVAKRYQCCKCGKTFSVRFVAIAQQRRSNINLMFMRCLCNKSPLKGLSAIFDLGSKSVYDKIDFIYERCMEFAASRERKLLEGMKLPKLYLSTDRQIYLVNWITRECRRNVQMYLTATADNKSRYVFAADLNYDQSVEAADIEKDAEKVGDYRTDPPFRKHARLWLLKDFLKDNTPEKPEPIPTIAKLNWDDPEEREILAAYLQATNRNKDKPTDKPDLDLHQLPWTGMSVHNEYTMYGHYLLVKRLVCGAPKVRISMDRDSGMESAVLAAFRDEIIDRRCDAFLVKIDRESKIDDRRYGFFRGKYLLRKYMKEHPDKTRREAQDDILKERVANRRWLDDDFWFTNPFPTVAEPEMEAAYITEVERLGEKHLARLFGTVSLLGVNIFFANLRRKQSMLERPISTPSAAGRKWYGYSAYNPRILTKIVAIHRVWFNYARRHLKQKITPAMRLGLAEKPIEPHRILYGLPLAEGRTKTFYYWERKERNETPPNYGSEPDPLAPKPEVPDWDEGTMPVIGGGTMPCFEDPTPTVYLDTETTGKFLTDEIIEIAIIDDAGNELLDTLVHTKHPISLGAFRTHGILKRMLQKKPTLAKIEEQIVRHIAGKHLVMFNAPFDYRYLTDAIKKAPARISCCQREHSQYHGKKHNEPEPYDRHSLQFACKEIGYAWTGTPHRAKPDVLACRAVWQHIRGQSGKKTPNEQRPEADLKGTSKKPATKIPKPTTARAPASVSVASPAPRPACRATAREPERVFLDVETTGKDTTHDQIIHIAIVDEKGMVLLDESVMPSRSICEEAFRKHGITMADLQTRGARPIIELIPKIAEAIKGKLVVTYTSFDGEILHSECQEAAADFCDCFECFSDVNPTVRGRGARTLEAVTAFYGHPPRQGTRHVASEDSQMLRRVCTSLKERRTEPCPVPYDPVLKKAQRAREYRARRRPR